MGPLKDTSDVVNSILKWINWCNYTPLPLATQNEFNGVNEWALYFSRKLYFFMEMELFQIFRTFLAMVSDAFCLWPFSHEDKMSAV